MFKEIFEENFSKEIKISKQVTLEDLENITSKKPLFFKLANLEMQIKLTKESKYQVIDQTGEILEYRNLRSLMQDWFPKLI